MTWYNRSVYVILPKKLIPYGGLRTMLDFTVSSGCDIPGRAMDSVEDSRTILCATPPPFL